MKTVQAARERGGILAIAVVVGLVGLLLIWVAVRGHEPPEHVLDAFVTELGIALVIAAFLGATLEAYMAYRSKTEHEQQRKEIESDLFRHLFGFGLRPTIVDELQSTIFDSKLTRDDLTLQYEFRSIPGGDQRVSVRVTVSYDVVNDSGGALKHRVEHYFENVVPSDGLTDSFTAVDISHTGGGKKFDAAELQQCVKQAGIRRILDAGEFQIPAGERLRVRYTYETVRRWADSEVWITTLAAAGMEIRVVVADEEVQQLAFAPDASHKSEPELLTPNATETGSRIYEWRIKNGLLPYQGIVLFWCPKQLVRRSRHEPDRGGPYVIPRDVDETLPLDA